MGYPTPQHLLNTSWTVHRLSPLHHGKEYHDTILGNADALKTYAKRLQDLLTGDVLRGVQVGLSASSTPSDDALVKAGALTDCRWEAIPTWSHWNEERERGHFYSDDDDTTEQRQQPIALKDTLGILVTLEYENATYKAALLAGPDGYSDDRDDDDRKDSTYLPLLLTRLPNPLRQTFVSFLSVTFDTYCSILRLPSSFLCATLDSYIASLTAAGEDNQQSSGTSRLLLESVMKETQLTLAFAPSVAPALRTLDVHLPRETLATFAIDGSKITSSGTTMDEVSSPFLTSLSHYFNKHLAMKIDLTQSWGRRKNPANEHIWLSKIASGAFVLGAEGRVKLVADPERTGGSTGEDAINDHEDEARTNRLILRANENILRALVRRAVGEDLQVAHKT
ncbi:hypothetical protein VTN77DRAFT_8713 [Rasamsonia byssochlamydoides]|uniref:uncharacterized protein n=1 Tax=Rasamsonia byssochlamydoides TaxID=89139 RepID=UPI003743952B